MCRCTHPSSIHRAQLANRKLLHLQAQNSSRSPQANMGAITNLGSFGPFLRANGPTAPAPKRAPAPGRAGSWRRAAAPSRRPRQLVIKGSVRQGAGIRRNGALGRGAFGGRFFGGGGVGVVWGAGRCFFFCWGVGGVGGEAFGKVLRGDASDFGRWVDGLPMV